MAKFTKEERGRGHDSLRKKRRKERFDRETMPEPIDDVPYDYRDAYDNRLKEEGYFEDN